MDDLFFHLPPDEEDPGTEPIRRFIEREVDEAFLEKYGAHAVGIARRRKAGQPRGELCLVLYVLPNSKQKAPTSKPHIASPLQWTDPDTGALVSIPTDVVEAQVARMDGAPLSPPGSSAQATELAGGTACYVKGSKTHPANMFTLGGWVWDRVDNSVVLLSNRHTLGDDKSMEIFHGDPVAAIGMNPPPEAIGQVKRAGMTFDGKTSIDSAIGTINDPARAVPRVVEIGPAVMAVGSLRRGIQVEKTGCGTGHTTGRVDDLKWRGYLEDLTGKTKTYFVDCIAIESTTDKPWSALGDSGSLVFASDPVADGSDIKPVLALHMGAATLDGQRLGVACRIQSVFKALDLATLPMGLFASLVAAMQPSSGQLPKTGLASTTADAQNMASSLATAVTVMLAFLGHLQTTQVGQCVHKILTKHRAEIVSIMLHSVELRVAAVRVLQPLFRGATNLDEVLDRSVAVEAGVEVRRFGELLKTKASDSLTESVDRSLEALDEAIKGGPRVGDVIEFHARSGEG